MGVREVLLFFYLVKYINICVFMPRRKIRLIESNAKCRYLKKLTLKGTLRQLFIYLRPPPLLGFCLGWSCNIVGPESGQKQNVKLLQLSYSTTLRRPLLRWCHLHSLTLPQTDAKWCAAHLCLSTCDKTTPGGALISIKLSRITTIWR